MTKTRWVFVILLLVVAVIVGVALLNRSNSSSPSTTREGPIEVRIVCALPVEPFVSEAAKQYNSEKHTL